MLAEADATLSLCLASLPESWHASIKAQFDYCCDAIARGGPTERIKELNFGIIATRELDMWGDQPEAARKINAFEDKMKTYALELALERKDKLES